MILAGIIEEREPKLRDYLEGKGLKISRRLTQGDWVSLTVEKAADHTDRDADLQDLLTIR